MTADHSRTLIWHSGESCFFVYFVPFVVPLGWDGAQSLNRTQVASVPHGPIESVPYDNEKTTPGFGVVSMIRSLG